MNRKLWRVLGLFLALFALGSIMLAGCGIQDTATNTNGGTTPTSNVGGTTPTPGGGGNGNCSNGTVHTLLTTFQESCVNVAKGSNLQVVPSVTSFHILTNGSWVNNNQVPMNEAGAPTVNNVQLTSSTISIGPFTTAGTYHIYCTVHPNMNLTVIVK
jgi:plastocyanin